MALSLLDPNDPLSGANSLLTQEQIAAQNKIAQALAAQAAKQRPMTHPLQAVAQGVEGLEAGLEMKAARDAQAASLANERANFASMSPGGGNPIVSNSAVMPSTGAGGGGPSPMPPAKVKEIIDAHVPEADREYAYRLAGKESTFNPSAVSPTGATGLFQFTKGTGAQYGLVGQNGDMRADPVLNTQAFVRLTNDNREALRNALGREPSYGELALAHQQGSGGAIKLLSGQSVDPNNLRVNGVAPGTDPRAAATKIMNFYNMPSGRRADAGPAPVQVASLGNTANDATPAAPAGIKSDAEIDQQFGDNPAIAQQMKIEAAKVRAMGPMPARVASAAPAQVAALPPQSAAATGQLPAPPAPWPSGDGTASLPRFAQAGAPPLQLPSAPQAAAVSPPLPPPRPADLTPAAPVTPQQRVVAALAQQQAPGMPEAAADQATMLNIARGGPGIPQGPAAPPAVQAVANALAARQGAPATTGSITPASVASGGAATEPAAAAISPAAVQVAQAMTSQRAQNAWRVLGSSTSTPAAKAIAGKIIEMENEQQKYQRNRQDTVNDRHEDQARADRDLPARNRLQQLDISKREAELPTAGQTQQQQNYNFYAKQEADAGRAPKSFFDWTQEQGKAAASQVTVNNAVNPILKGLGDQFVESASGARAQANTIRALHSARSQLDEAGGVITGFGADAKLKLQKLGAALGVADPRSIVNSETLLTQFKPIVLETVKGLGAGSGISNADRDFALAAVGGQIALDEGTIRRVIDITERMARAQIDRHNTLADKMLSTQKDLEAVAPMLKIDAPGEYSSPKKPGATTPQQGQPSRPPKIGDTLDGYRFKGGNPADQNAWEKVQ